MRNRPLWRTLCVAALILLLVPAGQVMAFADTNNGSDGGMSALRALRLKLIILALVCCLLPVLAASTLCADVDDRPIVVVRIDDISRTWKTPYVGLQGMSGFDYGKTKHIPITWACITNYATSGLALTWAELKDYLDTCGGEPASHSMCHDQMPSQQAYIDELTGSKAAIQANLPGYACNTFLQPGGWTGDAYMDTWAKLDNPIGLAIQATYAQSMSYLGDGWRIGDTYYRYGMTGVWSMDSFSTTPAAWIQRLDIVAATPGTVICMSGHQVQEQGGKLNYAIPADNLRTIFDKLADLRDQGKIRLMSLNDAYHATFSPTLNHVPDAGLEISDPSVDNMPWQLTGNARMVSNGGVDNSRAASVADSSSTLRTTFLTLTPGRYEMSWYQRTLDGKANGGLCLVWANVVHDGSVSKSSVDWSFYTNTLPTAWEKKTALIYIPERLDLSQILFQPAMYAGYGIDNLSVVSAPVDPAVSPSSSTVTATPGQCMVSWNTPSDPSVTTITVRYSGGTHPLTPTTGSLLCTVAARPGRQQMTVPLDWTTRGTTYFSVFGVKANGSYTGPDLAPVWVDRTPPTTTAISFVTDGNGTIHAQWTSSDPESSVLQYQYAVGATAGGSDVKPWTTTASPNATITGLAFGYSGYISVKAENPYGYWSTASSVLTWPSAPTVTATTDADGTIHAQWTNDAASAVVRYQYAVGRTPGGNDLKDWVSTTGTSAIVAGIKLGTIGYLSVKGANASDLWSTPGYTVVSPMAPDAIPIRQVCAKADGDALVTVTAVVTAVFADCCYVGEINRTRGIRVSGNIPTYHEGDTVTVVGKLTTNANKERVIMVQ